MFECVPLAGDRKGAEVVSGGWDEGGFSVFALGLANIGEAHPYIHTLINKHMDLLIFTVVICPSEST